MDKRAIVEDIDYEVYYSKPGKIVFDIVVNIDGEVTSCELNKEKSTITSTGAMMKGKNLIMNHLKFESGYTFPKFHRGFVQINTTQEGKEEQNKFAPPDDL